MYRLVRVKTNVDDLSVDYETQYTTQIKVNHPVENDSRRKAGGRKPLLPVTSPSNAGRLRGFALGGRILRLVLLQVVVISIYTTKQMFSDGHLKVVAAAFAGMYSPTHPRPSVVGEYINKTNINKYKGDFMKQSKYKNYAELPLMLSVSEVAAVLGISRAGAYELARSRGFPSLTIGTRIVVPKDKFITWIERKNVENTVDI